MKRNIDQLADQTYDLVVVGGGISGVFIAWDASLRGLRVALVERSDFGSATSANSMKTVHGGLRYLQDADIGLVRKMIFERKAYLRIAPHVVRPLAFVMPTYKKLMKSKPAMFAALTLNDLMGFDRNNGQHPLRRLPNGKVLSRAECLQRLPGLDGSGVTGAAVWYDAQVYNTERMLLSVLHAAVEQGAEVANYVAVTDFICADNRVTGVHAVDQHTGQAFDIRARMVVNAAGAWSDALLQTLGQKSERFSLSVAVNLIVGQRIADDAVAVPSNYQLRHSDSTVERRSNMLIFSPWRQYSMIGTFHSLYEGQPDTYRVTDEAIEHYLGEANSAYPGAKLTLDDVRLVHCGFLPTIPNTERKVRLVREAQIHDHLREDGVDGLVSAIGVKYTTARSLAQKTVDLIFSKLGQVKPLCRTATTPVYGGDIEGFYQQLESADPVLRHLANTYGSAYRYVLRYTDENPIWREPLSENCAVTGMEIIHAVRDEMAHTLADVVLRRTELGSAGMPDVVSLGRASQLMGQELGWTSARVDQELEDVRAVYRTRTLLNGALSRA